MAVLSWDKDRRAALWRHGRRMALEEKGLIDRFVRSYERRQKPASPAQIGYLQALLVKAGQPAMTEADACQITMQAASRLIESLKAAKD